MPSTFNLLLLITAQVLLLLLANSGTESKRFFGVGQRIEGDQLLVKDVQHSRPAALNEPVSVVFNYNIIEPITYIEIISEENISAEVRFSYTDSLVVGVVRLVANNESDAADADDAEFLNPQETSQNPPAGFDMIITIFGYNNTMLNLNPSLLLNRDTQFEGFLKPYDDYVDFDEESYVSEPQTESYDKRNRDDLQVDIDDSEETIDDPGYSKDFEQRDKIIEIGHRQEGDDLIYETYQTSPDVSKEQSNHTVIFYYIDSHYITYVKFVIFDHFVDKVNTAEDYTAPTAEYSHFSPGTLKATITDSNITSLFVQMFVYGYRGPDAPPADYKPFMEPPHWQRSDYVEPELTPLQRLQLLLLTGKSTTQSPSETDDPEDDDDGPQKTISPEDMVPDHKPEASIPNAAGLEQQPLAERRFYAMLGLMLFAVA